MKKKTPEVTARELLKMVHSSKDVSRNILINISDVDKRFQELPQDKREKLAQYATTEIPELQKMFEQFNQANKGLQNKLSKLMKVC